MIARFTRYFGLFAGSLLLGVVACAIFVNLSDHSRLYVLSDRLSEKAYGEALVLAFDKDPVPVAIEEPESTLWVDAKPGLLSRTTSPVDLGFDALGVRYILEKSGRIIRVALDTNGEYKNSVYANLATGDSNDSVGFAALAFHPYFLIKDSPGYGCFYVVSSEKAGAARADFYPVFAHEDSRENHQSVVYEFRTENPLSTTFQGRSRELMRISQTGNQNNVESLAFDAKGYLYIGVGDGARHDEDREASRNASSLLSIYGKILCIDPKGNNSENGQYGIPGTNPFRPLSDALPELWAYGLQAPNSIAVDPFRNWLCISERGVAEHGELNFSQHGAEHFGWKVAADTAVAEAEGAITRPVLDLAAPDQVIGGKQSPRQAAGGFVYNGERFPSLVGKAVFGDSDGRITVTSFEESRNGQQVSHDLLTNGEFLPSAKVTALRPGPFGEIHLLCENGDIYEVVKGATASSTTSKKRPLLCQLSLSFFN